MQLRLSPLSKDLSNSNAVEEETEAILLPTRRKGEEEIRENLGSMQQQCVTLHFSVSVPAGRAKPKHNVSPQTAFWLHGPQGTAEGKGAPNRDVPDWPHAGDEDKIMELVLTEI